MAESTVKLSREDLLEARLFQARLQNLDLQIALAVQPIEMEKAKIMKELEEWKTGVADRYQVDLKTTRLNLETGSIESGDAGAPAGA